MATVDDAWNGAGGAPDGHGSEELAAENARLRAEVARLEKEKGEAEREREMYRKSLSHLLWEDFTFTQEEIDDLDKNGVTLDERFFEELERDMRAQESSDA